MKIKEYFDLKIESAEEEINCIISYIDCFNKESKGKESIDGVKLARLLEDHKKNRIFQIKEWYYSRLEENHENKLK